MPNWPSWLQACLCLRVFAWPLPFLEGCFLVIFMDPSLIIIYRLLLKCHLPEPLFKILPPHLYPKLQRPLSYFIFSPWHFSASKTLSVFYLLSVSMTIFLCSGQGSPFVCLLLYPLSWAQSTAHSRHSVDCVESWLFTEAWGERFCFVPLLQMETKNLSQVTLLINAKFSPGSKHQVTEL